MKVRTRILNCWLLALLLATGLPSGSQAKSYSSGGRSYSSHSSGSSSFGGSHSSSGGSHSFSSGSHTFSSGSGSGGGSSRSSSGSSGSSFKSGSGKSYSSGSMWSDAGRHSYSTGKSYSSGSSGSLWSSSSGGSASSSSSARSSTPSSSFNFDTAAARARKEESSKQEFTRFKETQNPAPSRSGDAFGTAPGSGSYRTTPPPLPTSYRDSYRSRTYVPDWTTISTRPTRIYTVFNPYWTRPVVVYHDPYSSFFWWWLLDRSLDDRAWWAYHHRYDMDPVRYQALISTDQQLESRVAQLEAQQAPRDPAYTPTGLDRDLMYSDQYVNRTYSNRPTTLGVIAFWALGIPTALAFTAFFIWLIWFKRWQTAK